MRRLFYLPWLIAGVALVCAGFALKLAGPWRLDLASHSSGDLAVVYSGDGGWVALDQAVAKAVSHSGRAVVGVDALRYFWTARTPPEAAADLAAIVRERPEGRVVLIGYSFGADALPIIVRALPADVRGRLAGLVLIGPEAKGDLEFRPSQWWGAHTPNAYPVASSVAALRGLPVTCLYGREDRRHAACPAFPAWVRKIALPGGHHFNGDFTALGRAVDQALAGSSRPTAPR